MATWVSKRSTTPPPPNDEKPPGNVVIAEMTRSKTGFVAYENNAQL
jgi:hypothetical protein